MATFSLGKILSRKLHHTTVKGIIVETSHSCTGRHSAVNKPMYLQAGTTYVYMTFGIYHCLNISSKKPGAAKVVWTLQTSVEMKKSSWKDKK